MNAHHRRCSTVAVESADGIAWLTLTSSPGSSARASKLPREIPEVLAEALMDAVGPHRARHYTLSGQTFSGAQAAQMGLVSRSVRRARLREETLDLARGLLAKDAAGLRRARPAFRRTSGFQEQHS